MVWGQIARYIKPSRYYPFVVANTYNQGLRQDFNVVDRTASICGDICAAGLASLLTDPDRDWLELGPAIPNFELDREGAKYYSDLGERLNFIYDHSNFYEAQAQIYDDLTHFGTGVSIDYESAETILHVFTPCAGEYLLGTGFDNGDEVFNREFRQTVSASVEQFGLENCPPDLQQMWRGKGGALEYQNVIRHSIEPNFPILSGTESVGVVPGGFTWREAYWIAGRKNFKPLSLTGFHECPFAAARWKTQSNEAYGRGVGEDMLGDCIQLQLETRQKAQSIEKVNDPPMGADQALMNQPATTRPGKITYMNTMNGEKKFFPLYEIKPDIPAITADIKVITDRISRSAYNDVFQMLMTLRSQMSLKADLTATEVERLTQEVMTRLGPMIYRVYGTLEQRVRRHLAIMQRLGLMPPKPASLRGVPLRIAFVSLLTEARQAVKTESIARTMQFAGANSGAWPELKFAVDAVEGVRLFNKGVRGPPNLIREEAEIQALIAQEKKDQQLAQLTAQTLPGARAAEALSKASTGPGTALSALVQPPGQQ